MRAFSLSAIFGFTIDREVYRQAALRENKLTSTSSERIRDELFKILSCPQSCKTIAELDKYGILQLIFPQIRRMKELKIAPAAGWTSGSILFLL